MKPNIIIQNWRKQLYEIIYEADTPAGKLFDLILFFVILGSVVLVMLESVSSINDKYYKLFNQIEWGVTILFTLEYIARIVVVKKPWKYITSFYGIIDLLATIPKYISVFIVGANALMAFRALRLLRIFRILKLARYLGASDQLSKALKNSKSKIAVFIFTVLVLATISGTIMYLVEGEENGFTNIPKSIYWCIVTLTTVGYGDISPSTPLGQFIASCIMIMGYGIIAVPTGIVSAEYTRAKTENSNEHLSENDNHNNTQVCRSCLKDNHSNDAQFCKYCGEPLF